MEELLQQKIGITYCECVFVVLGIQHAMHIPYIVICGLPGSTLSFTTLCSKRRDFQKIRVIENKMSVLIFSTIFVWNISHSKKNSAVY